MSALVIFVWLYAVGLIGLNDLSRQYSNVRRTRKTWIGLIFWPVVIPVAWVVDKFDELVP